MTTVTPAAVETKPDDYVLAEWTRTLKRSTLREMLAVCSRPGIISFAGGLPAPELFPAEEYAEAAAKVLSEEPRALQYGPPFQPLKEHIVEIMALRGVSCAPDEIFITTGAQQALNVIARLLLNQRGQVMLEEVVYTGIQQVVAAHQPQVLTVPTDLEQGIDVDKVEALLETGARPAFLYVIPEAHNPLGVSISRARQERLIEVAHRFGMPIVEDDPYGLLRYDAEAARPLSGLDNYRIFYVGSFSKILAPALRLGWMVVPPALADKLTVIKEAYDLETSAFIQRTVSAYLDAGHLPAHLERLRNAYRLRRNTMLEALDEHFPDCARWTIPSGGMFIWVELPGHVNTAQMLPEIIKETSVAYIPGSAFSVAKDDMPGSGGATSCLRLNFSNSRPEDIRVGIARLGQIFAAVC